MTATLAPEPTDVFESLVRLEWQAAQLELPEVAARVSGLRLLLAWLRDQDCRVPTAA